MMETLLRADLYRILALTFAHPAPDRLSLLQALLEELTGNAWVQQVVPQIWQGLVALKDILHTSCQEDLEGEYHRLFATSVAVPLCENSYSLEDKGTILLDVSGFYRAFGLDGNRAQEPVDSIGHELEFLSVLALKEMWAKEEKLSEELAETVEAEQAFLREHLGRWYTVLAARLQQESPHPFYQAVAALLTQWIRDELERFAITPDPLPAHLSLQEPEGINCPLAEHC